MDISFALEKEPSLGWFLIEFGLPLLTKSSDERWWSLNSTLYHITPESPAWRFSKGCTPVSVVLSFIRSYHRHLSYMPQDSLLDANSFSSTFIMRKCKECLLLLRCLTRITQKSLRPQRIGSFWSSPLNST